MLYRLGPQVSWPYKCSLELLVKIHIVMASPNSSSGAFASPGRSTIKVYGDRVISTVQAPPYSSFSRGQGAEGPSGPISETVYFPSPSSGHPNLATRVSVLEEEVASLRSELLSVKGQLEAQGAEKQLLEEQYAQNIKNMKAEALRWYGKYLDTKLVQDPGTSLYLKFHLFGHDSE